MLRSHVMDGSLALAGHAGLPRRRLRKGVLKKRFKTPFVSKVTQNGETIKMGKWKTGHRHNPRSR